MARRLYVMSHGQCCDQAFGGSWMNLCFNNNGVYRQADLTLPVQMVTRRSFQDFINDSPLTVTGLYQGRATGDALQTGGVQIQHIYTSPALRCIQTAQSVITGLNTNLQMRIEPSLFEWLSIYKNGKPNWMTAQELELQGYSVDVNHQPLVSIDDLNVEETVSHYYQRSYELANFITTTQQGDILIVGHGSTLDAFTRMLQGKLPRSSQELHQIQPRLTYCAFCCLNEHPATQWSLSPPPIPPFHSFDWRVLE